MGIGRFICVAVPMAFSIASLACILIASLGGIGNKNLHLFQITTADFSASTSTLTNIADEVFNRDLNPKIGIPEISAGSINLTASTLGLAEKYRISIWKYCRISGSESMCTAPRFNWAASVLNTSALEDRATSVAGKPVSLPKEMKGALKSFTAISVWTQGFYIAAIISAGAGLILGLLSICICSRAGTCLTFFLASITSISIIGASILATVQATLVTAALNKVAKAYGVTSSVNTSFLVITWLAAGFSIAAGFLLAFSSCCCLTSNSSSRHERRYRSDSNTEKLVPLTPYERTYGASYEGVPNQEWQPNNTQATYGIPMRYQRPVKAGAYEPYLHAPS